jgi:TonB family protein
MVGFWHHQVYSGTGAGVVMESIAQVDQRSKRQMACSRQLSSMLIGLAVGISTHARLTPSQRSSGSAGSAGSTIEHEPQCRTYQHEVICRVGGPISSPELTEPSRPPILKANSTAVKCPCRVLVWAIVGRNGHVSGVKVIRPVQPNLDQRAIQEVKKWIFKPAKNGRTPVSVETNLEVSFQ